MIGASASMRHSTINFAQKKRPLSGELARLEQGKPLSPRWFRSQILLSSRPGPATIWATRKAEAYTMPAEGGLPTRQTFGDEWASVIGWTPDGKILYTTALNSTLPDRQLVTINPETHQQEVLPLSQASDGVFEPGGKTVYFTRLPFQGSSTKRYQGGTIQHIWRYTLGAPEAIPLTEDFAGTSKSPMWWQERVYFVSDRDGTMNLWSMNREGGDLGQITFHKGWDVKSPALSQGRIVYQLGPDLHLYDLSAKTDKLIPIRLASDFDQEREKWVQKPFEYLTSAHLSNNGDRLVLTARGQVFVAPTTPGRFVQATHREGTRYREARFMPDGKSLLALSDESGELEFCRIPANGVGHPEPLTSDGKAFRFEGVPSPDSKWIAYHDKDWRLWKMNLEEKQPRRIAESQMDAFFHLHWSPDSQWLAYVRVADNTYAQIYVHNLKDGSNTAVTSDRVNSYSPAWSPDGKWLYFLSERNLQSAVSSPWGPRQPEPFFERLVKIYHVSMLKDQRSPFQPSDELYSPPKEKKKIDKSKDEEEASASAPVVAIDLPGLDARIESVPVPPGNYGGLAVNGKHLFWMARETGLAGRTNLALMRLEITNQEPKAKTLVEQFKDFELSGDGKKILVRKDESFYVVEADGAAPQKLEKSVPMGGWTFSVHPREEWRQVFREAWRLERDYFYDQRMHGVDWPAMLNKYLPVVDRVTDRAELSDLIGDMVGELSALHIFVIGGDHREPSAKIALGALGVRWSRDEDAGGYRVSHIYRSDPDYPERASPLAKPGLNIQEGDIVEMINGVPTLSAPSAEALLRNQAHRQVLLRLKTPAAAQARDVIVTANTTDEDKELRYDEWEYIRRQRTEELGKGQIGYVHLRAMGEGNIAEWAREYYPVFQRQGLIIDVRHNQGGNIDSWILEKLLRKAWFYWQGRVGLPTWNMQYAFRGHVTNG
jgi:tricorn protease